MSKPISAPRAAATSKPGLAADADPYHLYELAVQNPVAEVDFLDHRFRMLRGRSAVTLREDFCGSAALCREWVRRRKRNRALGVDRDPRVLAWGRDRNGAALTQDQARRLQLIEGDVLTKVCPPVDLVVALNFSYWLYKDRAALRRYFNAVRAGLNGDGVLFLDAYGGYDAYRVMSETRAIEQDGYCFAYCWEQANHDPISGALSCHIHFEFPDASRLERAFSYDWRLWTLPEIRELLIEAGFARVLCYWQGWTADDRPDGRFEPVETGTPDAGWICYLSAEK